MAFLSLADFSGSIEAVLFPKSYVAYKKLAQVDQCVIVKARIGNRKEEKSLLIEEMRPLV